ncbi:hypothetical protein C10C_0898 [Chlamydia serpentis]|uniref:Uncharacterized protein n=1 Tax=Chlamydia serpentis TaxID=1967782 RepID=A0A2R8FC81_9CHLA|nr:hypothetical protein [Chlamydia serpentis]SPN74035.1 hypothetical protein C10C_0898 [Chlamydia serpentis]
MENSQNLHDTICELLNRYFEQPYPNLSSLLDLELRDTLISPEEPKLTSKQPPEMLTTKSSPIALPPPMHPGKEQSKSTDWYCVPLHPDLSKDHILKEKYHVLQGYVLPTAKIPCSIFVYEDNNQEVLFFNRLAKILTSQLFPTKLTLIHSSTDIFLNSTSLFLALAPLNVIRYKIPSTDYHQSLRQNECIFLPLYSSLEYEKDAQLKRNLWAILNRLPFAYTPKSS